jgi:hypothetical protein
MIARPAGRPRRNPVKPQAAKTELVNKNIDHPNRVVVTDPVFQPIRKQGALPAIHPFNETLYQTLPLGHERIIAWRAFSHSPDPKATCGDEVYGRQAHRNSVNSRSLR